MKSIGIEFEDKNVNLRVYDIFNKIVILVFKIKETSYLNKKNILKNFKNVLLLFIIKL